MIEKLGTELTVAIGGAVRQNPYSSVGRGAKFGISQGCHRELEIN
ncbi:MAG: hypothetical protein ACO3EZ_01385 [Prochlorotrichaceae cyanobacterium]|jgi:hypothetical protein